MYLMKQSGWVEVICGSMFSGKSEELIRRVRRAQFAKQKIAVFKPKIDNRYHDQQVVSHNGSSFHAKPIAHSMEILHHVEADIDIIAIDEVQFFDEGILRIVRRLADSGHRVVCAGLDMDFRMSRLVRCQR